LKKYIAIKSLILSQVTIFIIGFIIKIINFKMLKGMILSSFECENYVAVSLCNTDLNLGDSKKRYSSYHLLIINPARSSTTFWLSNFTKYVKLLRARQYMSYWYFNRCHTLSPLLLGAFYSA